MNNIIISNQSVKVLDLIFDNFWWVTIVMIILIAYVLIIRNK